jgi:hypothetical protein
MTNEQQMERKADTTIRHLEALLKLIHTLATGKPVYRTGSALKSSQAGLRTPAPKVRSKRKKSIKRKPVAKKRARGTEDYDTALWDFAGN